METPNQLDFGLAPQLRARLMGAFLAGIGIVLLVVTIAVISLDLPGDILSVVIILVVLGVFSLAFLLGRRWYVVRLDDVGYQVRFVRGAGEKAARWADVEDLATSYVLEEECVLIRLRDGRSTTIPVNLIEGDREEFVDELKRRLNSRRR
ncbi:MAG: hypothetical protein ACJ72E_14905 [Marmoricola sp.]